MISMPLYWFFIGLVLAILDVIFGNVLLLGIALASILTGGLSLFLSSVFLQVAIFASISVIFLWVMYSITMKKDKEIDRYFVLKSVMNKPVTVHYWNGNDTHVQLNGRVWPAEFAEKTEEELEPGQYKVWKILGGKLILVK